MDQLVEFARARPDAAGIVYRMSRAGAEETAEALSRAGIPALPYHAGLPASTRAMNQEAFIRDDVRVIAGTVAFGMGIDKPDLRWVVHLDLPKSVESYYQEIGRAGRDGLPADCILFYSHGDVAKMLRLLEYGGEAAAAPGERTLGEEEALELARGRLWAMARYAESSVCRRGQLLRHFGEVDKPDCAAAGGLACDACTRGPTGLVDLGTEALKFLSCVVRLGGVRRAPGGAAPYGYGGFGSGHVADVLRGEENEKVLQFGHRSLSTFGIGKELSRSEWMELARRLETAGYLEQDQERRSLRATDLAYAFFREKGAFMTSPLAALAAGRKPKGRLLKKGSPEQIAAATGGAEGLEGGALALFEALRRWRKETADKSGVPPYVVFSDRSLRELALRRPRDRAALAGIFGVGASKLERYGEALLGLIERTDSST